MSKIKRIAKLTHGFGCNYEIDGEDNVIDNCGINCPIAEAGGSMVVLDAMDAVDDKKNKRRRYQRRKKTRGW